MTKIRKMQTATRDPIKRQKDGYRYIPDGNGSWIRISDNNMADVFAAMEFTPTKVNKNSNISRKQLQPVSSYRSAYNINDIVESAANKVGKTFLTGMGAIGRFLNAGFTSPTYGLLGLPTYARNMEEATRLRLQYEASEQAAGKAMTWMSPLNYGAALYYGHGLDAEKGNEEIDNWEDWAKALGRAGEMYFTPKIIKGVKNAPKTVVNTAAKAGSTVEKADLYRYNKNTERYQPLYPEIQERPLYTERASTLSEAERLGVPKGERNNVHPFRIAAYPGYLLKTLMKGSPLEKLLSKNGTININNLMAQVNKASEVEKAIINKVLKEKFDELKVIDYNALKKAVLEELVTYERIPQTKYANYGMDRLGLTEVVPGQLVLAGIPQNVSVQRPLPGIKSNTFTFESPFIPNGNKRHYSLNTLGHSRTYTTSQEPKVLHVMESLSDWGLKSLGLTRHEKEAIKNIEAQLQSGKPEGFMSLEELANEKASILDRARMRNLGNSYLAPYLHDNYLLRLLLENLRYAAENGLTKMRYPTSETAAKIEGYLKSYPEPEYTMLKRQNEAYQKSFENGAITYERYLELTNKVNQRIREIQGKGQLYAPEHQTILKKYEGFPKLFNKLYKDLQVRIVTDANGNTWYEVDIPKGYLNREWQFKQGGKINKFYIDYIKALENPNRVGWNGKVWSVPTLKGYDSNQRGYGIDINKNLAARELTKNRPGKWITEEEADKLMRDHILYVYDAALKHIKGFDTLSDKRKAALLGMLYRGDSVNANKNIINIMEPDDEKFFNSISLYYKSKGLNERAKNSDDFFKNNEPFNKSFWDSIPQWNPPIKYKKQGGKMVRKMLTAAGGPIRPTSYLEENKPIWKKEYDKGILKIPEIVVTGKKRYIMSEDPNHLLGFINAVTGGGLNRLSPTQNARVIYDAGKALAGKMSFTNWTKSLIEGNNGIVSDEFAEEHPYISTGINLVGDVATGVGALKPSVVKETGARTSGVIDNIKYGILDRILGYNLYNKYLKGEVNNIRNLLDDFHFDTGGVRTSDKSGSLFLLPATYTRSEVISSGPTSMRMGFTANPGGKLSKNLVTQGKEAIEQLPAGTSISADAHGISIPSRLSTRKGQSNISKTLFEGTENTETTLSKLEKSLGESFDRNPYDMSADAHRFFTKEALKPGRALVYAGRSGRWNNAAVSNPLVYLWLEAYEAGTLSARDYVNNYNNWVKEFGGRPGHVDLFGKPYFYHPTIFVTHKQGGKMNIIDFLKKGSGIHIKKENKGKFTDYCGGKVTSECIARGKASPNPAIRKRATFADNARHFKHRSGGLIVQEFKLRKMLNNIINN